MLARSKYQEEEPTTNSSFRIDRNRLGAHSEPDVVKLPGLTDLLPKAKPEPATEQADQEALQISEAEKRLDRKKAQVEQEISKANQQLEAARADIETAKQDAEVIRQQAQTEAEEVRKKAKMDGYADGIAESKEEYEQVLSHERDEFARSVQALASAKHQILEQMEPGVLDLACHIAEKIVKESLNRNDELFMNIVKDTIKEVEDNEEIVLRLNKKEYDRFFTDGTNDYAELLRSSGVQIRQDMSVNSGECIVETEYGTLRSGIRTQLDRIKQALENTD